MRKNKHGISLIVLVITIIIMIILAATIIISLENTGIIGAAENAVCKTNIKQAQNLAVLVWSNIYTNPDEYTMDNVEDKLREEFEKNGLKYEDYNVEVTKNGINVSSKAGCTDSSGVEGGSGDTGSDTIPTNWNYAYSYDRTADTWTPYTINDGRDITGDIVIRMYKNGTYDLGGIVVDTFDMLIIGTGDLTIDDEIVTIAVEGLGEAPANVFATNIEIHEGITSIGEYCLNGGFGALKSIKLPNSLKTIGEWAFSGQYNLEKIEFGTGLEEIGKAAFEGCNNLAIINIPDTVTTIGDIAFKNCTSLKEITIPKNVKVLDGGIVDPKSTFRGCTSLEKVTILGNLTSWQSAFTECSALKEVVLAEGMTMIDKGAFSGCSSLTSIVLPSSLTAINQSAFPNALTTINFAGTEEQWNSINGKENVPSTVTIVYNYTGN